MGRGLGGDAGHDDAGRDGNEQGGDLRNEPVADGQHGKGFQGRADGHVLLDDADGDAAGDIDGGDDQAGDGIALDELHGAVHGAVELALLLDLGPAPLGLIHIGGAGAQVGVDGHLLAWHGIEGEACADLRHSFRALSDH